jgi:hypothetical protein
MVNGQETIFYWVPILLIIMVFGLVVSLNRLLVVDLRWGIAMASKIMIKH